MKTTAYTLTVVLLAMMTFAGCKKDSKEESQSNSFKVGTTTYDMAKGIIINSGDDNNSIYVMSVFLLSSGLTVHELYGLPDSISGSGSVIGFDVYTSGSDKLTPGDYIYADTEMSGTFSDELYAVNYDPTISSGEEFTEVTSGTLKVIKSGTEYEISFTGMDSNSKTVSGYYKGSLTYYKTFKKSAHPFWPKEIDAWYSDKSVK